MKIGNIIQWIDKKLASAATVTAKKNESKGNKGLFTDFKADKIIRWGVSSVFALLVCYFIFFYQIELVAQGRGITSIKNSDVVIKLPESAYIKSIYVSQSEAVKKGSPLITYRNIDDEYLLKKTEEILEKSLRLQQEIEDEICYLFSSAFSDAPKNDIPVAVECKDKAEGFSAGAKYVSQFYTDYQKEKKYFLNSANERLKQKENLYSKLEVLQKKQKALSKGGAETVRFYDLQAEITDLNAQIISHGLLEMEHEKKLNDKLVVFTMKRAERVLTLKQESEALKTEIIEKTNQADLWREKKQLSVIHSPITGSVLSMMDGISPNIYLDKGAELFVLKKEGVSKEVKARFDSRYRAHINVGSKVKIKISAPGANYLFSGVITEISSDSLQNEKSNYQSGRYYEVTVLPDQGFIDSSIDLGLDVDVFAISERATVFDYIMSVIPLYSKLEVW
jgi:hypothetical protein